MLWVLGKAKLHAHLVAQHFKNGELSAQILQVTECERGAVSGGCPHGGRLRTYAAALRHSAGCEEHHQQQHADDGEDLLVVILQVFHHGGLRVYGNGSKKDRSVPWRWHAPVNYKRC